MKIELWPIEKLIPYDNNPRKKQAVNEVANSISDEFMSDILFPFNTA